MKVVRKKSDGKIAYRSQPELEKGFGIKNAVAIHGGLPEDYEEVEITEGEWTDKVISPMIQENKIQTEMQRILRDQAVTSLKAQKII